ncbi:MAG: sensor histidine kinase [Lachnospiraceae bacterium]|nr:sensor histidine kinase [Lachnospiraceae bacterium]
MQQYTMAEFIVYGLLRSGSIIFFAFGILRRKARFSQRTTFLIFALMNIAWVTGSALTTPLLHKYNLGASVEVLMCVMLFAFMVLAIKDNLGKLLFVFFMLYTVGGLVSLFGKYIEIKWWPEMAYQGYRWTASLTIVIAIALVLTPFGLAIYYDVCAVMGKAGESTVWRYCWLIPATFYLFWLQSMYSMKSTLEYASKLSNSLYMIAINAAAYLIYHMVMRMVIEHNKLLEARAVNQALSVQVTQFKDLRERIVDARRARHDLRHHMAVLETIAEDGDTDALREYIKEFRKDHRLEEPIAYCENTTANAVLTYFSQMAASDSIACDIQFSMPDEVNVDASDIAVLLGNLMENAVQACRSQATGERRIEVRGGMREGGLFALIVDNTADREPEVGKDGRFISTKHDGEGIGTDSVRNIAERYGGVAEYSFEAGMFRASVMMYTSKMDK